MFALALTSDVTAVGAEMMIAFAENSSQQLGRSLA